VPATAATRNLLQMLSAGVKMMERRKAKKSPKNIMAAVENCKRILIFSLWDASNSCCFLRTSSSPEGKSNASGCEIIVHCHNHSLEADTVDEVDDYEEDAMDRHLNKHRDSVRSAHGLPKMTKNSYDPFDHLY
jgi:hypothetical protein